MTDNLKRTNLYQWHVDHGGRMVPFAGWEMPVQYPTGPIQEHHTTRQVAGLFDIDHMGQVEVRGPQAEAFVNHMVSWDVTKMKILDAHYAIFCYKDGTCVDDLFVYKLPDPQFGVYYLPGDQRFQPDEGRGLASGSCRQIRRHGEGYLRRDLYAGFPGTERPGNVESAGRG